MGQTCHLHLLGCLISAGMGTSKETTGVFQHAGLVSLSYCLKCLYNTQVINICSFLPIHQPITQCQTDNCWNNWCIFTQGKCICIFLCLWVSYIYHSVEYHFLWIVLFCWLKWLGTQQSGRTQATSVWAITYWHEWLWSSAGLQLFCSQVVFTSLQQSVPHTSIPFKWLLVANIAPVTTKLIPGSYLFMRSLH